MPKRITRSRQEQKSIFRSGYNCGINAAIFSIQIKYLRENKLATIEQLSLATKIPVKQLEGIEKAEMDAFMGLDIDMLSALSTYFDITINIDIKKQDDNPIMLNKTHVETKE